MRHAGERCSRRRGTLGQRGQKINVVRVNVTLGIFEAWSGFASCVAGTADLLPHVVPLLNRHTGKVAETSPTKLADRDVGTVEVVPLCPLFVDSQKDVPALGKSPLLFHLRGNSMFKSGTDLLDARARCDASRSVCGAAPTPDHRAGGGQVSRDVRCAVPARQFACARKRWR